MAQSNPAEGGMNMSVYNETDVAVTPQAVRAQLENILASETFVRSRRMQRFLRFIVEETLAGRADQLGEYAVGIAVFDRGPDFEPGLDPIVRNDARRLRLKLLEYYRQAHPRPVDQVAGTRLGAVPRESPFCRSKYCPRRPRARCLAARC
jgi:hypothetical protein